MEERFNNLKSLSKEELNQLKEELAVEIEQLLDSLDDKDISSYEKTEIRNDLSYDREKLEYIESIINERKTI